jgi:hypothetical protein
MNRTITLFCALVPFLISAQWSDVSREEFGNMISTIDKKISEKHSYSYEARQCFFKSAESIDTVTSMNFKYRYVSDLGILNMHQFNTLFVQDSFISVRIDSSERIILIDKPNKDLTQFNPTRNFSDFFNSGAKVQKNTTGKETIYKVKFDTLALFSNLKMWVNNQGDITKYTLIAGRPIQDADTEEQKFIYPRLDVYISNIKSGKEVSHKELIAPKNFFTDSAYSKLIPEYATYEVLDSRFNNEQK